MPPLDARYYVSFESDTGDVVTVLLDAASPTLTGGMGGWEVVDRPKRVGITRFKGKEPFRQDVAIVFDGVSTGESQEEKISTLVNMGLQPDDLKDPPKVKVAGTVHRRDLTWVLEPAPDWDSQSVMWDRQGGVSVRIRQAAVVHLLEFVDDQVLITAPSPAVAARDKVSGKNVKTPDGMTLKQLASIEYSDPDKYLLILMANPWLDPDPRKRIPRGTPLTIPSDQGGFPTTFVVP